MTVRSFFATALTLIALTSAAPAQAATIDFTGNHDYMGLVDAGNTGTIATNTFAGDGGFKYDNVSGLLPSNTAITFSYTFLGSLGQWDYVQGNASYKEAPYRYRVGADSNGWTLNQEAFRHHGFHDTSDTLDVSVSANMEGDKQTATVIITNLANVAANFDSYFLSYRWMREGRVATTYAVSSVPLPAALPLFGLGLAGLAGYRRRKSSKAA
ncbi:MAG: VPLPA-CTERM sorting domain-containing protein [Bdellovibrionales bacterium]|jgi:hypothetical protein